jgi:hypothetical protein
VEKGKNGLIIIGDLPRWNNGLIVMGDLLRWKNVGIVFEKTTR